MAIKLRLKKGDKVVVLAGKDKGKTGEITRVEPSTRRVVVSGVNMMTRHRKPSAMKEGTIEKIEAALDISNVAMADPVDGKPTRIGYRFTEDGRKIRFAKRSGAALDV